MSVNQKKEGAVSFEDIIQDFTFEVPGVQEEETIETTELDFSEQEEEKEVEQKEVVEEKKPEVQEQLKVEEQPEESTFFKLTKKLIDSGKWSDAEIEDEEGNTVKLSEYKNLSEDEYFELLEQQKEAEKEEITSKYLKADDADEDKKRIANIVLNGGDLKEIFQSPEQLIKPFDESLGWDLDNEEHQYSIVYQQYLAQGLSKERAKLNADADLKELTLDTKAAEIVQYHQKAYSEKLQKIETDLVAEREAERERLKTYKTQLSKEYKEQKLPETLSKRLIDLATKENSDGELLIDEMYNKVMQDPKEAKEVILFLADREAYLKTKMLETKKEVELTTFKKFNLIKDKAKKAPQEEKTETEFTFEIPVI